MSVYLPLYFSKGIMRGPHGVIVQFESFLISHVWGAMVVRRMPMQTVGSEALVLEQCYYVFSSSIIYSKIRQRISYVHDFAYFQ